jgi:threonine/homoserine/homoserine lactone efflux protein
MNTKSLITRTVIVFAALAVAGLVVAVSAQSVAEGLQQTIMVAIGSALFGASLTFFLVRLFSILEN